MPNLLTGQDAVDINELLSGKDVYCGYEAGRPGYLNGSYDNMAALKTKFPGKKYVSVGRDCIDIEAGLASPADAPGFVRGWKPANTSKPMCYANASTMPAVKSELGSAGISRDRYFLWVADWDDNPVIPSGYDGKQYSSNSAYDSDSFYDYIWGAVKPPPPKSTYAAPAGLTARGGHTSVALAWHAVSGLPGHPVTGYQIVVYNNPPDMTGGHWKVVRSVRTPGPVDTVQFGGLSRGAPYLAHVWALGSPASSEKNYASVTFRTG
jgi:hypothetical protein